MGRLLSGSWWMPVLAAIALAAAGCAGTPESRSGAQEQLRAAQTPLESFDGDVQMTRRVEGGAARRSTTSPRQASVSRPALDVSEVLVLVMSDKGLDALLEPSFRLGAEASVAAGPASGGSTSGGPSDMVTLARSKGAYAGVSLEGAAIHPDEHANRAFYGTPASAEDILVRGKVESRAAAPVQQSLFQVTQP